MYAEERKLAGRQMPLRGAGAKQRDCILEVRGLTRRFGRKLALDGVSFDLYSGQIVALLGPNGAGKTTCFNLIAGMLTCDGGSIRFNGHDIRHLPIDRRGRLGLGYLPQGASIFRRMSVADNVLAVLELRPDLDYREREALLEALLERYELAHLRDRQGGTLSGGERRRVEIARAMATVPRLLLLDEPFAGVDPITISALQKILIGLSKEGLSILITDHNVHYTLDICDRCYIFGEGRILFQGSAEEVAANDRVRATYLGERFRL